jgi:hypothetical protein
MITQSALGIEYEHRLQSASDSGFGFPPDVGAITDGLFGPNFQFTTPVSTPDSGSTRALLLLGVTAAFGLNLLVHRRSKG